MNKPCKTPIEDLRKDALEHYERMSRDLCSYNSFVVDAIKAYNPEATNGWRSVKDEPPEEADLLIAYNKKNKQIQRCCIYSMAWNHLQPTHWISEPDL